MVGNLKQNLRPPRRTGTNAHTGSHGMMLRMQPKRMDCTPTETALLASAYLEHSNTISYLHNNLLAGRTTMNSVKECLKVYRRIYAVVESLENSTKDVMEQFPIRQQIELIRQHNESFAREISECTNLVKQMLKNEKLVAEALATLRMLTGRTGQVVENGDEREIFAAESLPLYHEFTILYRTNVVAGTKDTDLRILVDSCKEHRMLLAGCVGSADILGPLRESQLEIPNVTLLSVELVDKTYYSDVELMRQAHGLWSESPKNGVLSTFSACLKTVILI